MVNLTCISRRRNQISHYSTAQGEKPDNSKPDHSESLEIKQHSIIAELEI